MTEMKPVVTGVVGLGGYAGTIVNLLLDCEPDPQAAVKLVACCSSNPGKHPEMVEKLKAHGVDICASYEEMLARPDIEAVWLPLPIDLHLPYTKQALEAGKAVMCEKPTAGCVDDCDAMIALRDKHKLPVAIGFQDIYDPLTLKLKRELLSGAFGKVKRASVWATWPRNSKYYGRAAWAGAFKKDGVWVMDSPANNALAHFINVPLFLLGESEETSATPVRVEAELYRVNPIENFDTISARFTLPTGVHFDVLLTHACEQTNHPAIAIEAEHGRIDWSFDGPVKVRTKDGEREEHRSKRPHTFMVRRFSRLMRGIPDDEIALSTLESSRAPLVAVNGASEATVVRTLPDEAFRVIEEKDGHTLRAIPGIEDAFQSAIGQGKLLHSLGAYDWTRPGGVKDLKGYNHFAGPLLD